MAKTKKTPEQERAELIEGMNGMFAAHMKRAKEIAIDVFGGAVGAGRFTVMGVFRRTVGLDDKECAEVAEELKIARAMAVAAERELSGSDTPGEDLVFEIDDEVQGDDEDEEDDE